VDGDDGDDGTYGTDVGPMCGTDVWDRCVGPMCGTDVRDRRPGRPAGTLRPCRRIRTKVARVGCVHGVCGSNSADQSDPASSPVHASTMKRSLPYTPETLEGHLTEERIKLVGLEDHLNAMRAAVEHMQAIADTMIHRWQVRDKSALICRIGEVICEIDRISTGYYITKLDKRASTYRRKQTAASKIRCETRTEKVVTSSEDVIINEFLKDGDSYTPVVVVDTRDDSCAICEGSMRLVVSKSLMCCCVCGYSIAYLDSTVSALAYGDDANLSATFSYKRINHFTEWITRIQAKTTHDVPQDTIDAIMGELAANRVKPCDVTQSRVRDALKGLKFKSKLNEYVPHITMRITGKHPPRLTAEMEQLLKLCFIALQVRGTVRPVWPCAPPDMHLPLVQVPFAAHAPADRKNFMSYSYVLFRICQLLGYDDILPSLTLLKGKTKLAKQDEIFVLCCNDLDWEWIPSTAARPSTRANRTNP